MRTSFVNCFIRVTRRPSRLSATYLTKRNRHQTHYQVPKMSQSSLMTDVPTEEEIAMVRKAGMILNKLNELFPNPPLSFLNHENTFQLLVAVLLSAQSTDEKVNKTTPDLFKLAATSKQMSELEEVQIRTIIKPIGLSTTKAKNILKLSKIIEEKFNGQVPDDIGLLETLPGVGHKTASVVIMQAFNKPAFPVDTHIHRLACRWGCGDAKSIMKTEGNLKTWFSNPDSWFALHIKLILFGRQYCKATRHDMSECPICKFAATEEAWELNDQFPNKFVASPSFRNPYSIREGIDDGDDADDTSNHSRQGRKKKLLVPSFLEDSIGNEEDNDNIQNLEVNENDMEIQPVNNHSKGRGRKRKFVTIIYPSDQRNRQNLEEDDEDHEDHNENQNEFDDEANEFYDYSGSPAPSIEDPYVSPGRGRKKREHSSSYNTEDNDDINQIIPRMNGNSGEEKKRKRGRPKKIPMDDIVHSEELNRSNIVNGFTNNTYSNAIPIHMQPVKRGRGRPRKNKEQQVQGEKRPRGRPRKIVSSQDVPQVEKRPRGRPRKNSTIPSEPQVKRPRGRPRKNSFPDSFTSA